MQQQLRIAALQILMRILLRLHHAVSLGLRWCENRLDDFDFLDDIVAEILSKQPPLEPRPEQKRPSPPVLIVRITRPRVH